jgi:hypothetical protein
LPAAAQAGVAERIEVSRVVVGGRVVAAETNLAELVYQADRRAPLPGLAARGADVGIDGALDPEAGIQAAPQIVGAAKADAARRQAVLRHRILLDSVVVEPASVEVEDAEQRDR